MIELRWLEEKETWEEPERFKDRLLMWLFSASGDKNARKLQYREKPPLPSNIPDPKNLDTVWSDWQDVPVIRQEDLNDE